MLKYSSQEIPEEPYGVHNSNAIMIIVAPIVSLYKPASFTIGVVLVAISLMITFRIFLKPSGNPVKKKFSWSLIDNF